MSIIINKPGLTADDASYGFLQVEVLPKIENEIVSIKTRCFDGLEASINSINGYWDASTEYYPGYYHDVSIWIGDASSGYVIDSSIRIYPPKTIDVSIWIDGIEPIFPVGWEDYEIISVEFELEASGNLINWAHDKVIEQLISVRSFPDSYMIYEADVFELDPSTGEPVLDPSTGQPIINHAKGDLVTKDEETYLFYIKTYDRFCEAEDVSIKL